MNKPLSNSFPIILALLCWGCDDPVEPSLSGPGEGALFPEAVDVALKGLESDLARLTAVGEALENEPEKQAKRFLEHDEFQVRLEERLAEFRELTGTIAALEPEAKAPYEARVQAALRTVEARMEAAMATGPAAQDAFGPTLVEIRDRLRASL